jgi:hypothetical protein
MHAFKRFEVRDHLADDVRGGIVPATPEAMVNRVASCGSVSRNDAAIAVERFLGDLERELARAPAPPPARQVPR